MADYKIIVNGRQTFVSLDTGATVADPLVSGIATRIVESAYQFNTQISVANLPVLPDPVPNPLPIPFPYHTYLGLTEIATILLPTSVFGNTAQVKGYVVLGVTCDAGNDALVWISTLPFPLYAASPNAVPVGLCGGAEAGGVSPSVNGLLTPPASAATPALYVYGAGVDGPATNVIVTINALLSKA